MFSRDPRAAGQEWANNAFIYGLPRAFDATRGVLLDLGHGFLAASGVRPWHQQRGTT